MSFSLNSLTLPSLNTSCVYYSDAVELRAPVAHTLQLLYEQQGRIESINRCRPRVTFKSACCQCVYLLQLVVYPPRAREIQSQYIAMNFNESRLRSCSNATLMLRTCSYLHKIKSIRQEKQRIDIFISPPLFLSFPQRQRFIF